MAACCCAPTAPPIRPPSSLCGRPAVWCGPETTRTRTSAGFDGHHGWVCYLAVAPGRQRLSIGRRMMAEAERLLAERGCPKINLLVRTGTTAVLEFYRRLGYAQDEVVSLGKRLIPDL